eukprot:365279-Chlamydomonas_euryale.AAC.9
MWTALGDVRVARGRVSHIAKLGHRQGSARAPCNCTAASNCGRARAPRAAGRRTVARRSGPGHFHDRRAAGRHARADCLGRACERAAARSVEDGLASSRRLDRGGAGGSVSCVRRMRDVHRGCGADPASMQRGVRPHGHVRLLCELRRFGSKGASRRQQEASDNTARMQREGGLAPCSSDARGCHVESVSQLRRGVDHAWIPTLVYAL